MDGALRWLTGAVASLLLSQSLLLQPAAAGDVVNYSDFLDSINKGEVEMAPLVCFLSSVNKL